MEKALDYEFITRVGSKARGVEFRRQSVSG
jgi:hypothetical protein